jgi:hypothetical protein
MAVVNLTGSVTTQLDSSPAVRVDTAPLRGRKRIVTDFVTVGTSDNATSTYRLGRVFSADLVTSLKLFNVAQTGFTSATVGLYQTAVNGGGALAAACYATGISLASGTTTGTELAFAVRTLDKSQQKVWADGGLTADSLRQYDIVLTATTIGTAGGLVMLQTEVVID